VAAFRHSPPMSIADDIRHWLSSRGKEPKDLALLAGIRVDYVTRVLSGERKGFGPAIMPRIVGIIYTRKPSGRRKGG
jgi:hypothetical protein